MAADGELEPSGALQLAGVPWEFDELGRLERFVTMQGQTATRADLDEDAQIYEHAYGRDVRALHGHNHNHDCTTTCVKYQKKKSAEELKSVLSTNKAPPCRFHVCRVVELMVPDEGGGEVLLRIRRRGKGTYSPTTRG